MRKVAYAGWKNCYKLTNGKIELILTGDVGPRIIRFGFVGGPNEFCEWPEQLGTIGGDAWKIYGGHRLWHAPEIEPRTYAPDNEKVEVQDHKQFIRAIQPVETLTGMQKEMDIALSAKANHVQVTHRITNKGQWAVELAPWALSVMAPGGVAIIPLPPRGSHPENLLPNTVMIAWAYTDMTDPRWTWGKKTILLCQQQGENVLPQKIGFGLVDGWAAYANGGRLFLKQFPYIKGAKYPDGGCNFEAFTNKQMLEVESLGPLTTLQPGATVEHIEQWHLFSGVQAPQTESDVNRNVLPLLKKVLR